MLDIKFIRENVELIKKAATIKKVNCDIDGLIALDEELRPMQSKLEGLLAERNKMSASIGKAAPSEREALKTQVHGIKSQIEEIEKSMADKKVEFDRLMLLVPNPPREDVPQGKDDTENVEVRTWGTPPKFDFKPLDHMKIGEKFDMIDAPRGVKLAGSRSYVLKGWGTLLEQAILRMSLDKLIKKGYTPMTVPVLVKEDCMVGTGYFPTGREQAYYVEKDELALVGTAEVSLTSYHSGEILKMIDLPVKMVSQSSCFRREAGTYGKDTSGLYRVHQFQKIEQVIVAAANSKLSEQYHEELLRNAEEILQDLELPYRVVYVCTGDLGQGQVRKHDIETWMPSRNAYSETHSCSTFHDFQARRLKLRYRDENEKVQVCYTLNNTAIATPRVLIPFLECHQQADGSVKIPKALQPYVGGKTTITSAKIN